MTQKIRNNLLGFAAGAPAGISYGLNLLFGKPCIAAVLFMIINERQ